MILLAALAANAVAYGPPSADNALDAFIKRTLADEYAVVTVDIMLRPDFPTDLVIHRCVGKIDRLVRNDGAASKHDGYDCVFEVSPNGASPYRTAGFFHYDGAGWRYHGPIKIENISQLSRSLRDDDSSDANDAFARQEPFNLIDDENNPLHPNYDPYADVLYRNRRRR